MTDSAIMQLADIARHPWNVEENKVKSGFYLLSDNRDAFIARIALIENASRSLVLQYYLMHGDASGRYIAYALLQAADRGVKVRILIDDINLGGRDTSLKSLAQHENIDIRVFNPLRNRDWLRNLELIINLDRAGRRMHNKLFIADDRFAIIGGRNIGDEYFDARKNLNFVDLDLLVRGPIIRQLRQSFQEYWDSEWATPIERLGSIRVMKGHLASAHRRLKDYWRRFKNSDYFEHVDLDDLGNRIAQDDIPFIMATAQLFYDKPEKMAGRDVRHIVHFGPRVMPMFDAARESLLIASPYFIPGQAGCDWMIGKQTQGLDIIVLTNSLGATDVPVVHAGYRKYRRRLLEHGIRLHELKRDAVSRSSRSEKLLRHRPVSSLHAKYIVIDDSRLLIGSPNIDPRSSNLNTEIAMVVDSPELARQVTTLFERTSSAENSYRVTLDGRRLTWSTTRKDKPVCLHHEPSTSLWRRLFVILVSLLPIESLL